jgi:hypothetical protein
MKMTDAPRLHDAANIDIPLIATQSDDGLAYQSDPLIKPGIYTMVNGTASYPIAVNVPTEEADTRAMDSESIRRALGGIDIDFQQDQVPPEAAAAQISQGREFGWSIMAIVLALVGAESFMAMKFGRYRKKA